MPEPTATFAGFRYAADQSLWVRVSGGASMPNSLGRPLQFATLNCLHDLGDAELLQHERRHESILLELAALDADVIGLNEVTRPLLERVLLEPWVRRSFTVSAVPGEACCSHLSTLQEGSFGNLLLSKIAPVAVAFIEQPGDRRHSHVATLDLCVGGRRLRVAVCSTHLTAFPWLMEGRRRTQLAHVTSAMKAAAFDVACVMGDFNFHREAENASIPDGWAELPAVVSLGATWDYARNAMLPHYLPLRNIYNGLGLGERFGWPGPMRLDRVLVCCAAGGCACDPGAARIFADQPVHERARGRPPLPQTGRELSEAHRSLPWEEYLHPSDHFGISFELVLGRV
ncbi:hypothetical protein EMIHUDRAFT_423388 [Emiliania huxleyi CCMP1516]|uniref:Endonuclease/exonuclease/phosphatase domain-containing protein n=2 Tax=Emiliania huxleyi TaxID=2903 RepID=A0A0D3KJA7_EMIH1|nr:hypothetical protein EMIHUDRAFT_423388 [Emiliania huxleyi CCMP1516]EOD35842.1 hypothetical protein EMIHUDRAFT_423388 [Emiliania huxleyi CCMP1516]|eukprot:XP_005788271.1 hypothetical protein EMIHUDRAFT_423388 [Emiliania huxleyi CCMP1516]